MTFTGINADGACNNHDPATQGFTYNHTMLRVKDPAKSLDFYTRILGMTLVRKSDYEGGKFSLYFLVMSRGDEQIPADEQERRRWIARQSGVLELTHNWGTESDPAFSYHNGNSEPRGYGHICISVPDFDAAIRWFDANHVPLPKTPGRRDDARHRLHQGPGRLLGGNHQRLIPIPFVHAKSSHPPARAAAKPCNYAAWWA